MTAAMGMRVPVTLITGYLGAGKTTLLRRIAAQSRMRLAMVVNEFGEIAVDSRLVQGKNIAMAELAGGCVCCSLSGEFSAAVEELVRAAAPEWIVVETTGAAEPAALAHDIRENMPAVRLDSIVTVVDADALVRFRSLGQTGREQIEIADVLIMNKADLAGESMSDALEAARALNPRAVVIEAERCGIDTGALFGIAPAEPGGAGGAKPHPRKAHESASSHFGYAADAVLEHDGLVRLFESLPPGIYRAKGFIRTGKGTFLLNYVAGRCELEDAASAGGASVGAGMLGLVFIGERAADAEPMVRARLDALRSAGAGGI
jgi:G3E family GTPase